MKRGLVAAVLAAGGGERAYLTAAGVMARLGVALGWQHYVAGWHITCTTGAIAAAVGAAVSFGLNREQIATAMALAVPASGGVQRAFGTDAKCLQVGFAVDAGLRAATLAARGATADPEALDIWLGLMGAWPQAPAVDEPAVPGGLGIKLFPACYAVQRPIACLAELRAAGQKSAVITLPDSISWLLNIRGSDIARNPVVQAFAVLFNDGRLTLFIDPAKLGVQVDTPADLARARSLMTVGG